MDRKHKATNHEYNPETLALGYGYDPIRSEGSVKPPIFLTSTFQFESADAGRRFFELAYGLREPDQGEDPGLIYSRLNNPNLQILEDRIAAWDKTDKAASFASGMAAISTTMLALLRPGDHVISSAPVYGGTHFLFENILPPLGIHTTQVPGGTGAEQRMRAAADAVDAGSVAMLYLETPANPSNALTDIAAVATLAATLEAETGRRPVVVVDNTFLGPVFQRPATLGADLIIYSATKFIGGHSDLVAGLVSGSAPVMQQVASYRTILGTMPNPFVGWLLLRSLETVSIRMRRQAKSARLLAQQLVDHPAVRQVWYPGLLQPGDPQFEIYHRQCTGPGSLIAFEVEGGQDAAYRVLDHFEVFRLAVSLGGTESLVEHPMTMTHADVPRDTLATYGVNAGLIRMSIGLEHISDLRRDLGCALDAAAG
ncbi:MAG: cystathionine gamma-synthase family protein [Oligoflexia bacterium]|nr:cystathionine gamma-synthase family protein [Oligoflexia bacterium]